MNPRLDSYLADLRDMLRAEPPGAAAAEVAEIRQHLEDSIRRLREHDTTLSDEEATMRALDQFGTVADYLQARPARAPRFGKYRWSRLSRRQRLLAAGALGAVAILIVAVAIFAIVENQNRRANEVLHQDLVLTSFNGPVNQSFIVPPGAPALRVSLHATDREGAPGACSSLTITDATGHVALSQASGCDRLDAKLVAPAAGAWTLRLTLTNFTGNFEMTVVTQTEEGVR